LTMAKTKKPKTRKKDEKSQPERFVEKAKELGADESAEAFERAFKKVVPPIKRSSP
jgi:lipoate-protein ligase A